MALKLLERSIINGNVTTKWDETFSFSKTSTAGTVNLKHNIYDFTCNKTGINFN